MATKKQQVDAPEDNEIKMGRAAHTHRRSYLRPILIKYGQLTIITAGGTAVIKEPSGGPGQNDPTKQRPWDQSIVSLSYYDICQWTWRV